MMKKILINATNLHNGGGIQVATSFILELSKLLDRLPNSEVFIYVSSEVNDNLILSGFNEKLVDNYSVLNVRGLGILRKDMYKKFNGFDLVFTVFGPLYLPRSIPNHIIGFAQPWIIYPDNDIIRSLQLKYRILLRLKFMVQWLFFSFSSARLVVELGHVKDRLVSLKSYPVERIDVVNNCVSSLYFDTTKWGSLPSLPAIESDVIKVGYVSRAYPHKNINFLFDIAHELREMNNIKIKFFVTLDDEEAKTFSSEFHSNIFNIGPLSVTQCPIFYQAMDAVIFPSLLECFSATPLEAMVMRRPLFASDRGFVRDCCGKHAIYIDPMNARQAAKTICNWFTQTSSEFRSMHVDAAYQHVISLPDSNDRASAYVDIINKQLTR